MNNIILEVTGVNQSFGDNKVLYDVDLKVVQGQFVSLVGPSGCGKSTLLKAILGTHPPESGTISTDGYVVRGPNRHVGIVYQQYSLYDFLTVEDNVALGPLLDETNVPQRLLTPWTVRPIRKRHLEMAKELLCKLKLDKAIYKYPSELSGGMRQRVAIAQALIMRPKILLLDEPFGALDEATREELQKMLLHLYQENLEAIRLGEKAPWTIIIITHELDEAFYVSDRVVGLSKFWYEDTPTGRISGLEKGATRIWDKYAPVYHPNDPRDFSKFHEQKQQLRRVVMDGALTNREEHVNFWRDLLNGVGTGVVMETKQ